MKAIAPGKIILSGEHAVVYGAPALGMAVDRSAIFELTEKPDAGIAFDLESAAEAQSYTLMALRDLKNRVERKYDQFLQGEIGIGYVLSAPADLFKFAFIHALDGLHRSVDSGLVMKMRSTIPMGCGMGSSAATVLSQLRALGHYLRVDFKPEWYYEYSLEVERLQHGHASGMDSYLSLHGGCAQFQQGSGEKVPLPAMPLYIVETGVPETSTGRCVEQVHAQFSQSAIWAQFEKVTEQVIASVKSADEVPFRQAIRQNHQLLMQIGVVPQRVASFIHEVEKMGGAAKICGAGAIAGDRAGVVLVSADQAPHELAARYGYSVSSLRGDPLGTRMV
jgi:mevalonate kinase